jgi:hypothetical protein
VGKRGLRGTRREVRDALPARPWSPWKSLLPALAVSLLAHGVLLFGVHVRREGPPPRTALVVTLRSATIARPIAAPAPAPAAIPQASPPPQAAPRAAPAPAAPPASAVPAPPPVHETAAATPDTTFHAAEELGQAPTPREDPDVLAIGPQLVARRLQVTVWIDAFGTVQKAVVKPNELSPEMVTALEQAIARVHFTPGTLQGEPVGAILRTLLCFDDAGLLDASSGECWKPQAAAGR